MAKEYVVYLNNSRLDCKGFFCGYPCVTAYTKAEANRLLIKALKYYYPDKIRRVDAKKRAFIKIS